MRTWQTQLWRRSPPDQPTNIIAARLCGRILLLAQCARAGSDLCGCQQLARLALAATLSLGLVAGAPLRGPRLVPSSTAPSAASLLAASAKAASAKVVVRHEYKAHINHLYFGPSVPELPPYGEVNLVASVRRAPTGLGWVDGWGR